MQHEVMNRVGSKIISVTPFFLGRLTVSIEVPRYFSARAIETQRLLIFIYSHGI